MALARRAPIALVVAEVALYFVAILTSEESPTHPSQGTLSTVFGLLFWFGILALFVIGVRVLYRRVRQPNNGRMTLPERAAGAYVKSYPGVAEAMVVVPFVTCRVIGRVLRAFYANPPRGHSSRSVWAQCPQCRSRNTEPF
jgi:hypothetical protein